MRQLPADDPAAAGIAARLRHARLLPGRSSPQTTISERDITRYLSRNHRKSARNRYNRLEHDGYNPHLEVLDDTRRIAAALDEVVAVGRARERQMVGRSELDDPRRRRFFHDVLLALSRKNVLELALLRADDAVVAYSVNFVDGRAYRTWNAHHHPAWAQFSPGQVLDYLLYLLVERTLRNEHLDTIDWMMGMEPYKLRAATHSEPSLDLLAWSSPTVAAATSGPRLIRHRLESAAEHDERVAGLLEWLRDLRGRVQRWRP